MAIFHMSLESRRMFVVWKTGKEFLWFNAPLAYFVFYNLKCYIVWRKVLEVKRDRDYKTQEIEPIENIIQMSDKWLNLKRWEKYRNWLWNDNLLRVIRFVTVQKYVCFYLNYSYEICTYPILVFT